MGAATHIPGPRFQFGLRTDVSVDQQTIAERRLRIRKALRILFWLGVLFWLVTLPALLTPIVGHR